MATLTDAVVEHLRNDTEMLSEANIDPRFIVGRGVHKDITSLDVKAIEVGTIGMGGGYGHRDQTPCVEREVEILAYDKFFATAEDLSEAATYSFLGAMRREYLGIFLVSVIQTDGPRPMVDEDIEWPCYQTIFRVLMARDREIA